MNKQESAVAHERPSLPGQVVLVLQGGGALGAFQGGVYEAMHERGVEPDWIIGTSIGAINGALIAGNVVERRLDRLKEFWKRVCTSAPSVPLANKFVGQYFSNLSVLAAGVPGFSVLGRWVGRVSTPIMVLTALRITAPRPSRGRCASSSTRMS